MAGRRDEQASRGMSDGQREYEARRAAAAGLSLDTWMSRKARAAAAAAAAAVRQPARTDGRPARKGLFARLLDRAHRPL